MESTGEKEDEKPPSTLTEFKPLSYRAVQREVETLQAESLLSEEIWQREVNMYEEVLIENIPSMHYFNVVPRRNYHNEDDELDTELFPYHQACYRLLEAYISVYHTNRSCIPGQLLCTPETIQFTITGLSSPELHPYGVDSAVEADADDIERRLRAMEDPELYLRFDSIDVDMAAHEECGLAHFPREAEARANILVKLLRHAMSDLQSDYLLAGEVLLRMGRWNLFQSPNTLRRVLCIIQSEVKECSGNCFDHPWIEVDATARDHSCIDVKTFEEKVALMISKGIDYISEEHALVFSGIVQLYLDKVNPAAAKLEESVIEEATTSKMQQSVEEKHRALLKQKLYISNNTFYGYEGNDDYEDDEDEGGNSAESQETNWIGQIVIGIGTHAMLARRRVALLRDRLTKRHDGHHGHEALAALLRKSIDSFHNCSRCLVHIGEAVLRRLPNNPRVVSLCSRLVFCLAHMFVEPAAVVYDYNKTRNGSYVKAGGSLIDPNRYADSILDATKKYRERHFPEATGVAERFLRAPPDIDVRDLVWCLFARDLVETSISRCGYGDIQIWWGLQVTPLDPLLFFDECNSPGDEALEVAWETDEEGSELRGARLRARHDLSLVLLVGAWRVPWSVEIHHSFQTPFREAVKALLLCASRMRMPADIVSHVCKFLPRDWWPDERARCFSEECSTKRVAKTVNQKLIHRLAGNPPKRKHRTIRACPGCSVAVYCCEAHRQSDYRDGHKSICGYPPYRLPGRREQELFNDILRLQESNRTRPILNANSNRLVEPRVLGVMLDEEDDDDGSGSWESIASDDEDDDRGSSESFTDIVHRFFERECYRGQRNEET